MKHTCTDYYNYSYYTWDESLGTPQLP